MESLLDIVKVIEAVCIGLAAIGGGVAIVIKCVNSINEQHDRREKYDSYDQRIIELGQRITDVDEKIDNRFNEAKREALAEREKATKVVMGLQEELQINVDGKLQQISSELCMLSYCVGATLDGLKQLDCNGRVSEAKDKMDKHLNQQAHNELVN